jgi:uncharacterized protein YndB with AHSA1/START domain
MNTTTEADRMEKTDTDRIEKNVQLAAPLSRVWRAISNSKEFGEWFRVKLEGQFAEGKTVSGHILHKGYEHMTMDMIIERIQPERYFSFRWHPYPIDPKVDYSKEPTTLVEFHLEEADGGTALKIVESGFDRIPLARRAEAFRMNDNGWTGQLKAIAAYVARS